MTLKFRSRDRYTANFEDLSSATNGTKTKLEADWGITNSDYQVVYSHSTKAPNTRTINDFKDINTHDSGFESEFSFNDNLMLAQVGNLTIYERVYKGAQIDLGSIDAQVSVTLWYSGIPSAGQQLIIAQPSFKYEDFMANYTQKVVQRALIAFDGMNSLSSWNLTGGAD